MTGNEICHHCSHGSRIRKRYADLSVNSTQGYVLDTSFLSVAEGQVCPDGVVGTTKTTSSINSKTCTLKVTCPANTKLVTGNADGNQFVQCVNCNKGTGLGDTPKGCDAVCDSSSCDVSGDRGCKWSDSGAETCSGIFHVIVSRLF